MTLGTTCASLLLRVYPEQGDGETGLTSQRGTYLGTPIISITVQFSRGGLEFVVVRAPVSRPLLPGPLSLHPLPGLLPRAGVSLSVVVILLPAFTQLLRPVSVGSQALAVVTSL